MSTHLPPTHPPTHARTHPLATTHNHSHQRTHARMYIQTVAQLCFFGVKASQNWPLPLLSSANMEGQRGSCPGSASTLHSILRANRCQAYDVEGGTWGCAGLRVLNSIDVLLTYCRAQQSKGGGCWDGRSLDERGAFITLTWLCPFHAEVLNDSYLPDVGFEQQFLISS